MHQSFNRENWFCFFVRTLQPPVFANYVHRLSLHSYDTNTPRRRIHTQTTSIEGLSRGRCFLALALYIKIDCNLETVLILTLVVLHIGEVGDTMQWLQLQCPPKRFDISPPLTGGCSEGLGAF